MTALVVQTMSHLVAIVLVLFGWHWQPANCTEYADTNRQADLLAWNGNSSLSNDDLPWSSLTELSELEQQADFHLKVIVLTMNRPESLNRLLSSLNRTYFEFDSDQLDVEIHVDKSHGTS